MGASNFWNKEADKIYGIECEEYFEYDDIVHNLQRIFKQKVEGVEINEEYKSDNERNYTGNIFAEKSFNYIDYIDELLPTYERDDKFIEKLHEFVCSARFVDDTSVQLQFVMRNGYYSGVNLDYNTEFDDNYNFDDTAKNCLIEFKSDLEEAIDCEDISSGEGLDLLQYVLENEIFNTAQCNLIADIEKTKKLVNSIYSEFSTPLEVFASFSNGETIYKKIDKK